MGFFTKAVARVPAARAYGAKKVQQGDRGTFPVKVFQAAGQAARKNAPKR